MLYTMIIDGHAPHVDARIVVNPKTGLHELKAIKDEVWLVFEFDRILVLRPDEAFQIEVIMPPLTIIPKQGQHIRIDEEGLPFVRFLEFVLCYTPLETCSAEVLGAHPEMALPQVTVRVELN